MGTRMPAVQHVCNPRGPYRPRPPSPPAGNTTEPLVIAYQRFPSATIDINGTNVAANATISAAVNVTDCPNPPCTSSWLVSTCPRLQDAEGSHT